MASSIVRRSITSISWTAVAQVILIVVGFGRSILLARLLDVETFGIYAGALAIVALTSMLPTFGMSGAYMHRSPETEDEDRAAAVFLSLQLLMATLWAVLMITLALLFAQGPTRTALVVIVITSALEHLTTVPVAIHNRRVHFRHYAIVIAISQVSSTVVMIAMALWGFELWALLSGEFVLPIVLIIGLYLWKPIWRAHLAWDAAIVRYYLRFGLPTVAALMIENALQRLDDIYVRYRLGVTALGYYSRAYTFANYPRNVLALPISLVTGGAFAELAHDRRQLSKAFFRTLSLLVRAGFLLAGWLVLIAPEFVTILLGDKWLPMVPIFRLLSVFALLDPVRDVLTQIFIAVGQPRKLVRFRLVQLGVLVLGLVLLGELWGTVGVALAADLMVVAGITQMVWAARPWVDFSPRRLFVAPSLALMVAMAAGFGLSMWMDATNLWLLAFAKSAVFAGAFAIVMLALERTEMLQMIGAVRGHLQRPKAT